MATYQLEELVGGVYGQGIFEATHEAGDDTEDEEDGSEMEDVTDEAKEMLVEEGRLPIPEALYPRMAETDGGFVYDAPHSEVEAR